MEKLNFDKLEEVTGGILGTVALATAGMMLFTKARLRYFRNSQKKELASRGNDVNAVCIISHKATKNRTFFGKTIDNCVTFPVGLVMYGCKLVSDKELASFQG